MVQPLIDPALRASDADRHAVLRRLGQAAAEGRLTMDEYGERADATYAARTYGDLAPLLLDLPVPDLSDHDVPLRDRSTGGGRARRALEGLPLALRVLWTIWATGVAVNLVIWVLVSISHGPAYFWPAWVAGPSGASLLAVTLCLRGCRPCGVRAGDDRIVRTE